ncbi:protein kinase 1 [Pelomyxa schiedti]|nr:protein kinase 1 [Pelomyxa schiedti]
MGDAVPESGTTQEIDWSTVEPTPVSDCWGRLISMVPGIPTLELRNEEITLGRDPHCDFPFYNPRVSGQHCKIVREDSGCGTKLVFLVDLSSNGTWLQGTKIGKGNKRLLSNGAAFSLVKDQIVYLFSDLQSECVDPGGPQTKYEISEILGTGNFAVVNLGIERQTGKRVAIKVIDKKRFMSLAASHRDRIRCEVDILQSLSHDHIIKIYESFESEKALYLILELVTGGDLFGYIHDRGALPEDHTRMLFKQMVSAVVYLHNKGVVHRDLKPENILLLDTNHKCIKISDFGLSKIIDEQSLTKTLCGTPQYSAPEIINGEGTQHGYSKSVDMWSLGCILYCMLSGDPPFNGTKPEPIPYQIVHGLYDFEAPVWKRVTACAQDLIKKLLMVDPNHRLTAVMVEGHPWFKESSDSALGKRPPTTTTEATQCSIHQERAVPPTVKKPRFERKSDPVPPPSLPPPSSPTPTAQCSPASPPTSPRSPPNEGALSQRSQSDSTPSQGTNTNANTCCTSPSSTPTSTPTPTPSPTSSKTLPPCKYGPKCYRKNPQHFAEFSHPWRDNKT